MSGTVLHRPEDEAVARTSAKADHHTVAELTKQASQQLSDVVRSEMRLAQAEMKEKGKKAGVGGAMFAGAALLGLLALWAIVFAVIAAISTALPVWASALIVAGVLLLTAGALAVLGKYEFGAVGPAKPERTIDSVRADVDAVKEGAHR